MPSSASQRISTGADRAEQIAVARCRHCGAAGRRPGGRRAIASSESAPRDLEPAEAPVAQEALMSRPRRPSVPCLRSPCVATPRLSPPAPSCATVRNSSGATRIAAPVGQARTQAGPPAMPEHMSHLIAFLGVSGLTLLLGPFLVGLARARAACRRAARRAGSASSAAACPCGSRHRGSCAGNCRSRCRCRR